MIDWVKAIIPFQHDQKLADGHVISLTRDGEQEWEVDKRLAVTGSHDSRIHLRSDLSTWTQEYGFSHIVFDGNPAKFLQGHNLWGTDDLIGLMAEVVIVISNQLGISPTEIDWAMIYKGQYQLKRVDSTMMIDLPSRPDVEAFLYSAERTATMRYKGQSIMTKGTLYFGKHSRREALKMYAKGTEIRAKGHELPKELQALPSLYDWADTKLRIEVTTRSMQLKDDGLEVAANWQEETPKHKLNTLLERLEMSEKHTLTDIDLTGLPPRLVAVYHLWKEGHDMRKLYPRETFRRYRKQLISHGIDISIKQGNRLEPAPNVIEFRRVLRPERCAQVPEWAMGTPLYFEPRRRISYEQMLKEVKAG